MRKIFKEIKRQETVTGLRIIQSIDCFMPTIVVNRDGKTVYRGDDITCRLYIMKQEKINQN